MSRLALWGAAFVVAACALGAPSARSAREDRPRDVVVVTSIEGELAESMIATIDRAVSRAEDEHAAALIVEIDTPGGEISIMDRIGLRLDASKVSPTTYVVKDAASAGAYIAMCGEKIFTNEHATIGSSKPILIPFGMPGVEIDPTIEEKMLSYVRSKFRDRAQSHNKPGMAAIAEAMVDQSIELLLVQRGRDKFAMTRDQFDEANRAAPGSVALIEVLDPKDRLLNLTAKEAFDLGFTDGIVASREELLTAMGLSDPRVIEVKPSWSEKLVELVESVRWLLLVAGLILLYVELKMPGFGLPGILGCACIGLFLFHNYLVGLAEMQEILLVGIGMVLIAVEVFFVPGTIVAGAVGIGCVAAGILLSCLPFIVPEHPGDSELLQGTMLRFFLSLIASVGAAYVLSRFVLPHTPIFKRLVLDTGQRAKSLEGSGAWLDARIDTASGGRPLSAGDLAVAASDLSPAGKIEIEGRLFDAQSDGDWVARGTRVRVMRVEASRVLVRAERGDGGA